MPIRDSTQTTGFLTGIQESNGQLIAGIQDSEGNVLYELATDFYQDEFFVPVQQIFVNADGIYGTTGQHLWRRPLIGGITTNFAVPTASTGTIVGVGGDASNLLVIDSDNDIYQTPFASLSANPTWTLFSTQFPNTLTDVKGIGYVADGTIGGYYVTDQGTRIGALTVGQTAWGTSTLAGTTGIDSLVDVVTWQDGTIFFGVLEQDNATIYARSGTNTNYGRYEFPSSVTSPRGVSRYNGHFYVSHGTRVTRHAVRPLEYITYPFDYPSAGSDVRGGYEDNVGIYLWDDSGDDIDVYTKSTQATTELYSNVTGTGSARYWGLAGDSTYLYLLSRDDNTIRRFLKDGTTTVATVIGMAIDIGDATGASVYDGKLYVSDRADDKIYCISVTSGELINGFGPNTASSIDNASDSAAPQGLAVDGDYVAFVDWPDKQIYYTSFDSPGTWATLDLVAANADPNAMWTYGGYWHVFDRTDREVYRYAKP